MRSVISALGRHDTFLRNIFVIGLCFFVLVSPVASQSEATAQGQHDFAKVSPAGRSVIAGNQSPYAEENPSVGSLTPPDAISPNLLRPIEIPIVPAASNTVPGSTAPGGKSRAHPPLIIAHRGGSGVAPEESLEAYRKAVSEGADFLECDVSVTADHKALCSHETSLSYLISNVETPPYEERFPLSKWTDKVPVDYVVNGTGTDLSSGWLLANSRWHDVQTVKLRQRYADRDQSYNDQSAPLLLDDFIEFAQNNSIGIYLEPKHSSYMLVHKKIEVVQLIIDALLRKGVLAYDGNRTVADVFPPPVQEAFGSCPENPGGVILDDNVIADYSEIIFKAKSSVYNRIKHKKRITMGSKPLPLFFESFTYNDLIEANYLGLTDALRTRADLLNESDPALLSRSALEDPVASVAEAVALVYDARNGTSPLGDTQYFIAEKGSSTVIAGPVLGSAAKEDGISVLGIDKNMSERKRGYINDLHKCGFKVHAWTFRNEPAGLVLNRNKTRIVSNDRNIPFQFNQDPYSEFVYFFDEGADGLFADFPGSMAQAIDFAQAKGTWPAQFGAI